MKKLYSHYSSNNKKQLKDHLQNVAEKSSNIIFEKDLNLSIIDKNVLQDLSYLIGIAHDFGKSTTFFQDYLIHGKKNGPSHHGLISAILAYLMIGENYDRKLAMIGYMVIRRHHGNLESPLEDAGDTFFHTKFQVEDIKSNNFDMVKAIYNQLLSDTEYNIEDLIYKLETFIETEVSLSEFFREIIVLDLKNDENDEKVIELFLITNLLYSVLIDTDKKDAARINNDYFLGATEGIINVGKYIDKLRQDNPDKFDPEKEINKARNEFFDDVVSNPQLKKDNYLYNLTAPTGIGKTFVSFAFANELKNFYPEGKRIIYCLPYTSIIDQNYNQFEKIISFNLKENYQKQPTKYLLRHHYLTPLQLKKNINIEDDSQESKNLDKYLDDKLLLESWESGNIVTTFVQLLQSIIGNKNSFLKKFHNIVNSIIILDEVQNIPVKYYNIVGKILKVLAKKFNTYILLMTATQPEIISGDNIINLVDDNKYGKKEIFDRVNLNIIDELSSYNIDEFIDYFEENFNSNNGLIVCNTVSSALKIYQYIDELFSQYDYQVYSLTTNLIPLDRERIINEINNKIKDGKKIIVVSTQLIEAGVDMSFEEVYRDFGPLDSIIQVAGRCNRSGELPKKGQINIIKLENDNGENYCEKVYNKMLLDICENILDGTETFINMSKKYFVEIRENYKRSSNQILNAIRALNYSEEKIDDQMPINKFQLIEEQRGKEDIIICKNKNVENKLDKLKEIYGEIKNIDSDRKKLNRLIGEKELINKELAKYRISVYTYYLDQYRSDYKIIQEFRFIKYVNYEDQKEYLYDNEIGFLKEPKKPPQTSIFA